MECFLDLKYGVKKSGVKQVRNELYLSVKYQIALFKLYQKTIL